MRNLAGFVGELYPVHPSASEVLGRRAYPTVSAIPAQVDLVLLAIPRGATLSAINDCVTAGAGAAIVYSGGWAEAGEDGSREQSELRKIARDGGIRLLGPNTSGFVRPDRGIFATFVAGLPETLETGSLAIVAQSGGVNLSLCFLAQNEGLGVRLGVGLGNSCDVGMVDVLEWLADDDEVSVVALAVEGIAQGRELYETVERLSSKCPVVAMTVGRTDVAQFAKSHTGVLSGNFRLKRAALAQAGAVVVDDMTELIDDAQALSVTRMEPSEDAGVGVVTGQAGPGLLLADALRTRGVRIPVLSAATQSRLTELLPALTYQENPVDTGRPGEGFRDVLSSVRHDDGINMLVVSLLHEPDAVSPAHVLADLSPAVLCSLGPEDAIGELRTVLREHRIAVLPTPERAASAVAAVTRDARHQWRHLRQTHHGTTPVTSPTRLRTARWDEDTAKSLLHEIGVSAPERIVCGTRDAAHNAFAKLGGSLAVKMLHPEIIHKTGAGGVHLNVTDLGQLDRALDHIDQTAGARYLLERMASPGPELIVGARRDESFGPLVIVGRGGVDTEIDDDTAIRLAPLGEIDAHEMFDELRCAPFFRGFRGGPTLDEDKLARILQTLGWLIVQREDIGEVEINPLRVTDHGLFALDALVIGRAN